ncbi:MAG: hypothetical protein V1644_00735 [Candidatus Micrarchaeota archaeon]
MPAKEPQGFLTEEFSKKLPILLFSLVFFLLSCYTFTLTGITFSTLFDFSRFVSNPTQLLSLQAGIFLVIFTITISVTAFFGFGLKMQQALAPLALFTVISLASLAVLPGYMPFFLALGLAFGSGALLASKKEKLNFDSLSASTRRALTIFLILVVVFSIVKIELGKDAYMDQFLVGSASLSPQLAKQVLPLCVQPFSKVDVKQVVPRGASDLQAQSNYEMYRSIMVSNLNSSAAALIPTFSQLNPEDRNRLQSEAYAATTSNVKQLIDGLVSQLQSDKVQEELSSFKPTKRDLDELRSQLSSISYFQLIETYFSLFIAIIIFSLVSAFTAAAKFITYPINYIIVKASEIKIEAKE